MAPGGRRTGRAPSSRAAASSGSGSSNARRSFAQRQEKASQKQQLPSSIHDVFDYVTEQQAQSSGSKRARATPAERSEKRMQRTLAEEGAEGLRQDTSRRGRGRPGSGARDDDGLDEDASQASDVDAGMPDYGTTPIFGDDGADSDGDVRGVIRSEDDEDIDSDEAFGESDEERYADIDIGKERLAKAQAKSRNASVKRSSRHDASLSDDDDDGSESEGSEGSIDDADMVDLSRMLDDDDDAQQSASDQSSDASSVSSDDADDESDDDHLQKMMEAYSSAPASSATAKRSASEARLGSDGTQRKRVLQDRTEAVPEGDWSAPATGDTVTFEDLMRPIAEQGGTSLASLRKNAKALQIQTTDHGKQPVASKRGGGALSAPLPAILQDRLDRSAAYDETKAEVQGWQPTIRHLREAEHLSFPLQPEPVNRPSTAFMSAHFRPSNDFEANVAKMLEREGASEKQIAMAEELKMNERGMSAEEIKNRTAELRRMRELLFREEQKAKRVSKIKSKTYRRIARRQKQRELEKLREAGLDLPSGTGSDDEEERLKAERLRAQERASLKHKNAGKWAKNTLGAKGLQDMPEARQALEEQLRRGEELRRRIHGDDSSGGESESSDDEESADGRTAHDRAFDELDGLENDNGAAHDGNGTGIMGMKFMQDARKRRAKETQDDVAAFMKEMDSGSDAEEDVNASTSGRPLQVSSNSGRLVFNDTSSKARTDDTGNDESRAEARKVESLQAPAIKVAPVKARASNANAKEGDTESSVNPWLTGPSIASKVSRKKNDAIVSKSAGAEIKAANRARRHAAKNDITDDDGDLMIDPTRQVLLREQGTTESSAKTAQKPRSAQIDRDESASDSEGSLADEPQEINKRNGMAISQRDLVAEAFAGDDVLADFAAEKQAIVDAERPKEVDMSLPGWGSWAGKGVKTSKKQAEARKARFTKTIPGLDPTKRKDAGMSNVIINHKQDKKADKYKAKDVPYPYTSRAQYEMAMRNPLGPEWNTRTQHQRLTLPRVVTKPGKVIQPIERLF